CTAQSRPRRRSSTRRKPTIGRAAPDQRRDWMRTRFASHWNDADQESGKYYRTDTGEKFGNTGQLATRLERSIAKTVAGRAGSTGQAGWRTVALHSSEPPKAAKFYETETDYWTRCARSAPGLDEEKVKQELDRRRLCITKKILSRVS
ncbi:MAG: hypothetical protein RLZZ601_1743, partial [Pseudomonadota bacterium]